MTIAAKNFDRYLLPIFPALDLLAGLGLWRLAERLVRSLPLSMCGESGAVGGTGVVLLAAVVGLTGWWVVCILAIRVDLRQPAARRERGGTSNDRERLGRGARSGSSVSE